MRRLLALGATLALLVVIQTAAAAPPQKIGYQGVLRDEEGVVVPDGYYGMAFRIYDGPTGGLALWTEIQSLPVENGVFNVLLGDVQPIDLPFDAPYWLAIQIGANPEMIPRVELVSVPYAYRALYVDGAGADEDWVIDGDDIYRLDGSVGIGSTPRGEVAPEGPEGDTERAVDRGLNRLYVRGANQKVIHSALWDTDDEGDGRAAIYAYRSREVPSPGIGYAHWATNNAITGYNAFGDEYTFGVAGYTWYDEQRTGGVLGSKYDGTVWAALGYEDEFQIDWGIYTPNDARVGGFVMPVGAINGYVLTCDGDGAGTWQPGGGGGGGIYGAGTADFIAKFTGETAIGDSDIYNADGAVGIGTTSPDASLDIERADEGAALEVVSSYSGPIGHLVKFERTGMVQPSDDVLALEVPPTASDSSQFIECRRGGVQFAVGADGSITAEGDATVGGDATVEGAASLIGGAVITNGASISGSATITGGAGITGGVTISDGAVITGGVDIADGALITEGATIDGDLRLVGGLDVQSANDRGGAFRTGFQSDLTRVVRAEYTATGEYDAVAVFGRSAPADYYGIGGSFEGGFRGISGVVFPTGTETYNGVHGRVSGGSGTNHGVHGHAFGTGVNRGVYGYAGGSDESYAGYFAGDTHVTGTLTKAAGAFKIDHPLDPDNMYLYHSFVESPDMKNVYDGIVELDFVGEAWVVLPDWFEELNRDFRYQLTPLGAPAPNLYIAQEIMSNQFRIAGGDPGLRVSWLVTGIRKDAYAEANRIPVEEMKPAAEQGRYLHPSLHGAPEQLGVDYQEEKAAGGQ